MNLRRTANAGFLLELDGAVIALDAVSTSVFPYLATPEGERSHVLEAKPDLLAYTHSHADHFDPDFAQRFTGPILGPVATALPGKTVSLAPITVKGVRIIPVITRHIGKSDLSEGHCSFVIEGSRCIWFTGDAGPVQLNALAGFPKPDVLIAPFAYATTPSALRMVHATGAKELVLCHLPPREQDPDGLWSAVEAMLPGFGIQVRIPDIGETQYFYE